MLLPLKYNVVLLQKIQPFSQNRNRAQHKQQEESHH
jgi:uncharacterized membrane protein affecting hemolysin expression